MQRLTPAEAVTAAPLRLAAAWYGHAGDAPRATASDAATCLLLAGTTTESPGRLIWQHDGVDSLRTSVWEGSWRELRQRFETLRLEALALGHYPHQPFLQDELLLASRGASISLVQRIAFVDMTIHELRLPEPNAVSRREMSRLASKRGIRGLRRLPSGQRAMLALSPMAGPQTALYAAPQLRGDRMPLVRSLEAFAERSSVELHGVSLLDLLICDPPHPPLLLDLLAYESVDVRDRSWLERQALLAQLLNELPDQREVLCLLEPMEIADDARVLISETATYGESGWSVLEQAA